MSDSVAAYYDREEDREDRQRAEHRETPEYKAVQERKAEYEGLLLLNLRDVTIDDVRFLMERPECGCGQWPEYRDKHFYTEERLARARKIYKVCYP